MDRKYAVWSDLRIHVTWCKSDSSSGVLGRFSDALRRIRDSGPDWETIDQWQKRILLTTRTPNDTVNAVSSVTDAVLVRRTFWCSLDAPSTANNLAKCAILVVSTVQTVRSLCDIIWCYIHFLLQIVWTMWLLSSITVRKIAQIIILKKL